MTQPPGEPREITSLPTVSGENTEWIAERLEREKQKRVHRRVLFWGAMIISVLFFLMFISMADKTDLLSELGESSPYCVWIVALTGVIPTVLLVGLMRGIYAKDNQSAESSEEAIRIASTIIRSLK